MEPPKAEAPQAAKPFVLPVLVFGLVEVRRLKRELEALDEYMRQLAVREPGKQAALPRLSRVCEALAAENHLNLLQPDHMRQLQTFLVTIETTAPTVHISFASDPSSAFTAKVVTWLRQNIHGYTLLQIGLQPVIAAGCIVRTPNKIFDFSLRQQLEKTKPLLLQAFEGETSPPPQLAAAPPAVAASTAPISTPAPAVQPAVAAVPAGATQ